MTLQGFCDLVLKKKNGEPMPMNIHEYPLMSIDAVYNAFSYSKRMQEAEEISKVFKSEQPQRLDSLTGQQSMSPKGRAKLPESLDLGLRSDGSN